MWGLGIAETLGAIAVFLSLIAIVFRAWSVIATTEKRERETHKKIKEGDKEIAGDLEKLEREYKDEADKLWVEINNIKDRILDIYKQKP